MDTNHCNATSTVLTIEFQIRLFVNVNWLKKVILFFSLDRPVTKKQILHTKCQPQFFVVVSFRTEKRPGCPFLNWNDNKNHPMKRTITMMGWVWKYFGIAYILINHYVFWVEMFFNLLCWWLRRSPINSRLFSTDFSTFCSGVFSGTFRTSFIMFNVLRSN